MLSALKIDLDDLRSSNLKFTYNYVVGHTLSYSLASFKNQIGTFTLCVLVMLLMWHLAIPIGSVDCHCQKTNTQTMRWILLLVGITLQTIATSQSTLKIYVANDDSRSDMDIIDLNTSALDRYGQSVDSTNMNFYTTTMSTQVLRMSRLSIWS